MTQLLTGARVRAKALGLPFNLVVADIEIPDVCPVLGIPLYRGTGRGGHDWSPTLDRVDPAKGYVVGNVCVMSLRANRFKNDATVAELRRVADWLESWEVQPVVQLRLIP